MDRRNGRIARRLQAAAVGAVVIATVLLATAAALASAVEPVAFEGTRSCSDYSANWFEVPANPPADGQFTDGTLTATVSNFDGTSFDWSSNITLDAVLVADANGGNFYRYEPDASSDAGLGAPGGAAITGITFCYGPSNIPSPSPTVSPTETATPTVSPTSTSTPPVRVSPSATVQGAEFLPGTGASVLGLVAVALAMMVVGAASFGIASRSRRRT